MHDTVEDATGDAESVRAEIRRRFGTVVLEIVDGCTDAPTKPKLPFRERKERYIAHLPGAPSSTRLVSVSDKLYNARAILSDYRAIGEALWVKGQHPLWGEQDKLEGAMMFDDLIFDDVRQILEKFYAGRSAEAEADLEARMVRILSRQAEVRPELALAILEREFPQRWAKAVVVAAPRHPMDLTLTEILQRATERTRELASRQLPPAAKVIASTPEAPDHPRDLRGPRLALVSQGAPAESSAPSA